MFGGAARRKVAGTDLLRLCAHTKRGMRGKRSQKQIGNDIPSRKPGEFVVRTTPASTPGRILGERRSDKPVLKVPATAFDPAAFSPFARISSALLNTKSKRNDASGFAARIVHSLIPVAFPGLIGALLMVREQNVHNPITVVKIKRAPALTGARGETAVG